MDARTAAVWHDRPMHSSLRLTLALVTLLASAPLVGCGGSTPATDSGTPAADTGTPGTDSGTPAADTGTPAADSGTPGTDSGTPATDAGETTYMMAAGSCFTFATASSMPMGGMECGDIMGLTGANVDLQSPNGPDGMGNFCPQTGTFTSLASVPTDYSACAWTAYVEGIVGLANTGYIVRDAAQTHHYRMRVISNTLPNLVFSFAQID
jgi:hypothetical protein